MKKVINIIIAVLLIISLGISVYNATTYGHEPLRIVQEALTICVCILILWYNFLGYKKPHGNLLRYIYLVFGVVIILSTYIEGRLELSGLITIVAGILIVYMSGRLNKIEKNKYIAIVVLVFIVATTVMKIFRLDMTISFAAKAAEVAMDASDKELITPSGTTMAFAIVDVCSIILRWIALALAYMSRYKEHKEAGLEDK